MHKFFIANLNIFLRISIAYGYIFILSDSDDLIHKFIIFTIFLGCFLQFDGLLNGFFYRNFNSTRKNNSLKYKLITSIFMYLIVALLGCFSFYILEFNTDYSFNLIIIFLLFFLRFCDCYLRYRIDIKEILKIDLFSLLFGLILLIYISFKNDYLSLEEIILLFILPMFINGLIKFFYFIRFVLVDGLYESFDKSKLKIFDKKILFYLQYLISAGFIFNLIILIINHISLGLFFSTSFLFAYRLISAIAEVSSVPVNTLMPRITKAFYEKDIVESINIFKRVTLLSYVFFIIFISGVLLISDYYNSYVNQNIAITHKGFFLFLSLFLLTERILSYNLNFNLSINFFTYQSFIFLYWIALFILSFISFYLNNYIMLFTSFSIMCLILFFVIRRERGLYLSRILLN